MTEAQIIPLAIPQPLADRYVSAMSDLISVAHQAIATTNSPQATLWRQKLVPVLESRLFAAKTALTRHTIGDENPLLAHALQSRFLARDMDGYSLNFAGEDFAVQLKEKQQLVVYAAWQICQSAGAV